jgi:hypothetical protein
MRAFSERVLAETGRRAGRANTGKYSIEGELLTYEQIAEKLGVGKDVARMRMAKAKKEPGAITWEKLRR